MRLRRQGRERHVGNVYVDSGQILILEPTRLSSKDEYDRVLRASNASEAGEVWLRDSPPVEMTADGVVVGVGGDGQFPVFVTYSADGTPTSIRIDLA